MLVLATGVAMVVTQKLRREGTVIALVSGKQQRGCPGGDRVPVSFVLTRDDEIDVRIVRLDDETLVRTLARDRELEGERRHCFRWDGKTNGGSQAAPGTYRLQVSLDRADRVATAGQPIRLEAPSRTGAEQ
ncbi:MAG: hypothetical protein EXQ70_05415 [Solirubrobacterales bacterium]|nr:hypothetical protein [Solirubrobacterales bacterium]